MRTKHLQKPQSKRHQKGDGGSPFSSLLSWPLLSPAEPGGLPGEGPLLLHQSDQARRVVGPSTRQSSLRESLDDESWLRLPLQQLPLADRWPLLPAPLPRRLRDELLDASSSCDRRRLSFCPIKGRRRPPKRRRAPSSRSTIVATSAFRATDTVRCTPFPL